MALGSRMVDGCAIGHVHLRVFDVTRMAIWCRFEEAPTIILVEKKALNTTMRYTQSS
jgi:hypothetical protein